MRMEDPVSTINRVENFLDGLGVPACLKFARLRLSPVRNAKHAANNGGSHLNLGAMAPPTTVRGAGERVEAGAPTPPTHHSTSNWARPSGPGRFGNQLMEQYSAYR
jgi:hypothetical protein